MTNGSVHERAPAPQRWRNESPGRRERTSEADGHEGAAERYSSPHKHLWTVISVDLEPQPAVCLRCGVPRSVVEPEELAEAVIARRDDSPTEPKPGDKVMFFSMAGPCLPGTVIRRNPKTYTIQFYGSVVREGHRLVHLQSEPCRSCQHHTETSYPNGYMD